jgi:hypothetical protein
LLQRPGLLTLQEVSATLRDAVTWLDANIRNLGNPALFITILKKSARTTDMWIWLENEINDLFLRHKIPRPDEH